MRSPHKSDKAVESQHVPASAAVPTRGPIPTPAFGERVVGAAAIALVASLVIQNAVLVWAGAPGFGDPIDEFFDWSTWIAAIIGAILLLLIYRLIVGRSTRGKPAY